MRSTACNTHEKELEKNTNAGIECVKSFLVKNVIVDYEVNGNLYTSYTRSNWNLTKLVAVGKFLVVAS